MRRKATATETATALCAIKYEEWVKQTNELKTFQCMIRRDTIENYFGLKRMETKPAYNMFDFG